MRCGVFSVGGWAALLHLTSGHCLSWSSAGGLLCYHRFTRCQLLHKSQCAKQHVLFQPHRLCYYWLPFLKAFGVQSQPAGSLKAELPSFQSQEPRHWLDSAPGMTETATIQYYLSIYFWFPVCVVSACVTPHNMVQFWIFGWCLLPCAYSALAAGHSHAVSGFQRSSGCVLPVFSACSSGHCYPHLDGMFSCAVDMCYFGFFSSGEQNEMIHFSSLPLTSEQQGCCSPHVGWGGRFFCKLLKRIMVWRIKYST